MIVIFIIWIVFILLQPKKNESRKEVCKIKDFCNIEEKKKLIEKIVGCKKISENSSITNLGDYIRLFNVYNIII